jgi:two-component system chemotaxis sensor kinase CheA
MSLRKKTLLSLAGALEDRLAALREQGDVSSQALEEMKGALALLFGAFNEVIDSTQQILGDELDDIGELYLRVPVGRVKMLEGSIALLDIDPDVRAELLESLQRIREVPVEKSLARTTRVLPDLIQRLRKEVRFRFDHDGVAVDLELAHALNGPLIHLLRNAIDHGIEAPETRRARGKPAEGEVRLAVRREPDHLEVDVSDDGAGIDPERLRAVAVARGLLSDAEAGRLTVEESHALIFRPGFSTATQVSDISGRGVGMDAVLATVRDRLGGELRITSSPGAGTTFTLRVPLQRPAAEQELWA